MTGTKGLGLRQQARCWPLWKCLARRPKQDLYCGESLGAGLEEGTIRRGGCGYEQEYPDPEKMNKELDRRGKGGLVGKGLLGARRPLIYRLTAVGLAAVSELTPGDSTAKERASRELENSVRSILEHLVFKGWLTDSTRPKHFREASHFWGIAPWHTRKDRCKNELRLSKEHLGMLVSVNSGFPRP